jgi:hypothetical protein
MSKLVIFGDSFATKGRFLDKDKIAVDYPVWYELMSNKLQQKVLPFGLRGSSIDYSIEMLYKYINSNLYSQSDTIIFVSTSIYRNPIIYREVPLEIAYQWIEFLEGSIFQNKENKRLHHYEKYREFYKTLFRFFNSDTAHQKKVHVALLLKSLPNRTIILSAFQDVDTALKTDRRHLLNDNPKSLVINASLHDISTEEYEKGVIFPTFYRFFNEDPRHAHLSKSNNIVLADQLCQCLQNTSNKYFDRTKFKKNFIKLELNDKTKKVFDDELLSIWKDNFI